jgi:hypothetical protein
MNSLLGKYGNHVENLIRYRPLSKEGAKIKMGTRVLTYNTYLQVYFPEEKGLLRPSTLFPRLSGFAVNYCWLLRWP